jgi:hypothetical protein
MSAQRQVLQSGDMVGALLQFVGARHKLVVCSRVNKLWHELVYGVESWRELDIADVDILANSASTLNVACFRLVHTVRFITYSNRVDSTRVAECMRLWGYATLPALRRVVFGTEMDSSWIDEVPTLTTIEGVEGYTDDGVHALAVRNASVDAEDLHVTDFPNAVVLDLQSGIDIADLPVDVCARVESLSVNENITQPTVEQAFPVLHTLFSNMNRVSRALFVCAPHLRVIIDVWMNNESLDVIAEFTPCLEHLSFEWMQTDNDERDGTADGPFVKFASKRLRHLGVNHGSAALFRHRLLSPETASELRSLYIAHTHLTEEVAEALATKPMPHLRALWIHPYPSYMSPHTRNEGIVLAGLGHTLEVLHLSIAGREYDRDYVRAPLFDVGQYCDRLLVLSIYWASAHPDDMALIANGCPLLREMHVDFYVDSSIGHATANADANLVGAYTNLLARCPDLHTVSSMDAAAGTTRALRAAYPHIDWISGPHHHYYGQPRLYWQW